MHESFSLSSRSEHLGLDSSRLLLAKQLVNKQQQNETQEIISELVSRMY